MTPREFVLQRLEEAPNIGVGVAEVVSMTGITVDEARALFDELRDAGTARFTSTGLGKGGRIIAANATTRRDTSKDYLTTIGAFPFRVCPGEGFLHGLGYLAPERILELEFRGKKGRKLYRYFEVPLQVFKDFEAAIATPQGPKAFRTLIRDHFPYVRVR